MADYNSIHSGTTIDTTITNADTLLTPQLGETLYSTGNTGVLTFSDATPDGSEAMVQIRTNTGRINVANTNTGTLTAFGFFNPNGEVGTVKTDGTATSYNTSSDPRLKDFKPNPSDIDIDDKFSKLFDSFAVFNWKTDPTGQLVWGFNAHKAIDNGLDVGTEGQGARNLNLGDKYKDAVLDADGNEVEPALYVSPAGVDQSKAVPILLAKLEQLERRLKVLEG